MFKILCQAIACPKSIQWAPPTARLFSICHINQGLPKDPEARRKALDKYNTTRRIKFQYDEAYRENSRRRKADWFNKNREAFLEAGRSCKNQKYQHDEHFRKHESDRRHRLYQKYRNDTLYLLKSKIYRWVTSHPKWVPDLPWKSHHPIYHAEAVEHFCEGCRHVRHGGSKLWWVSKAEPDTYKCTPCHVQHPDEAMPAGYEHVRTYKQLVARKKELDGLDAKKPAP